MHGRISEPINRKKEVFNMNRKILAAVLASAMVLAACTACGSSSKSKPASDDSSSKAESKAEKEDNAETDAPAAETAAPDGNTSEFEQPVVAESGDAFLAVTDGQWYVQYWGNADDILTYDAGVAHINGDGDYSVSVNVATKGAQFDVTGNPDGDYKCGGLTFACIKVVDGTTLYPNMSIDIKEIRVDGNPITLAAKNYTSSDDNVEMRANIFNNYISSFPSDAHKADGPVTGEFGEYSSMIVNPEDFKEWSKIEVDFSVSGIGAGGDAAPAEEGADEAATE